MATNEIPDEQRRAMEAIENERAAHERAVAAGWFEPDDDGAFDRFVDDAIELTGPGLSDPLDGESENGG